MTEPYWSNGVSTLYHADAKALPLPDASVHCVVTSPPYWGLRDYGLGRWQGGDAECSHKRRLANPIAASTLQGAVETHSNHQLEGWAGGVCGHCGARQEAQGIGLEPTLGEWVEGIVAAMREVHRVLRSDGTLWLNLGDAYAGSWGNYGSRKGQQRSRISERWHRPAYENVDNGFRDKPPGAEMEGLPPKNLMGQPWRIAFALQDDGWILRSAVVWAKPNPMPESVADRPTSSYEMIFMFSKQGRYFYDGYAIKQASITGDMRRPYGSDGAWQMDGRPEEQRHGGEPRLTDKQRGHGRRHQGFNDRWDGMTKAEQQQDGANARNVWTFPTQPRPEAHFATYPDELPRRCILAGTSERGVCADCGAAWVRVVEKTSTPNGAGKSSPQRLAKAQYEIRAFKQSVDQTIETLGWQPTCGCNAATVPATVLDPFVGSGTTVYVAQSLGRRGVGVDLNPEYLDMARDTVGKLTLPMHLG